MTVGEKMLKCKAWGSKASYLSRYHEKPSDDGESLKRETNWRLEIEREREGQKEESVKAETGSDD